MKIAKLNYTKLEEILYDVSAIPSGEMIYIGGGEFSKLTRLIDFRN